MRKTVEETPSALVDENVSDFVGAGRLGAGALKAPAPFALWNGHDYVTLPLYSLPWANKGYRQYDLDMLLKFCNAT